jgi:hypothetical protein
MMKKIILYLFLITSVFSLTSFGLIDNSKVVHKKSQTNQNLVIKSKSESKIILSDFSIKAGEQELKEEEVDKSFFIQLVQKVFVGLMDFIKTVIKF